MAERLTPKATQALLSQVASDMTNADIAAHAGIDRKDTVTDWRRRGMPKASARLLILSLQREAMVAASKQVARMDAVLDQFKLTV